VQAWQNDYPWLQLAFKQIGRSGSDASEAWRVRIEDDLQTTLDYKARPDGTATVWCGLSGHDFPHAPTPKELLEGLADSYRLELERLGLSLGPVSVATRYGPVEISRLACDLLIDEVRRRGDADDVVRSFGAGAPSPVELDRKGKIVVFDALWALAESDPPLDPQLAALREAVKDELAEGPAAAID
jgi:hypothetical protein